MAPKIKENLLGVTSKESVLGGGRSPSHRSRPLFVYLGEPVKGLSLDRLTQVNNLAAIERCRRVTLAQHTGGGCEPELSERF